MKRWAIISVIFITIFAIFIGCQRRESTKEEVYKEFQKKIVTMSSYKCIAEIEASGNKSSHNYVFIHSYVKPDYYKLEVVEPKNLKGKTLFFFQKLKMTDQKLFLQMQYQYRIPLF